MCLPRLAASGLFGFALKEKEARSKQNSCTDALRQPNPTLQTKLYRAVALPHARTRSVENSPC